MNGPANPRADNGCAPGPPRRDSVPPEAGIHSPKGPDADTSRPVDEQAAERDGVELWGRRIGRVLGWTAVALLLIYLFRTYGP